MFHACAARFDVTGNLKNFLDFGVNYLSYIQFWLGVMYTAWIILHFQCENCRPVWVFMTYDYDILTWCLIVNLCIDIQRHTAKYTHLRYALVNLCIDIPSCINTRKERKWFGQCIIDQTIKWWLRILFIPAIQQGSMVVQEIEWKWRATRSNMDEKVATSHKVFDKLILPRYGLNS